MTRTTIRFLMALTVAAAMAVGATAAPAKQGADDPAGHVRHTGTDDGAKAKKAKKCKKVKRNATAAQKAKYKKCKKAAKKSQSRSHGADDPANHDAGDDKGGERPAGVSDDPATHDAGDDNGGDRPDGVSDDPADHDAGDDNGGHGGDDA
jgi:hypothetical protein